ncbi:hypothetical protein RHOSPDRAFT_24943 [Rhodotorula sp. JG-1b]|nr:hypothetical protein RHOSPDRAFT_24943 [Rhodotorula sp. JG-1b]
MPVAPASMHRRQRQQSAPPAANHHSTSVTLHFKERNNPKQPLCASLLSPAPARGVRPAANFLFLGNQSSTGQTQTDPQPYAGTECTLTPSPRAGSVSRELFAHPSPPHSPSIAVTESRSSSWLNSLAGPFSPLAASANDSSNKELGATSGVAAVVRGYMIPRSQWKADDSADQCADPDCSQRFDLMHRRHHCRTCGDIYCSAHSSRSTFLWPSAEDDAVPAFTPRATPRSTPRSSAIDLPSLVNSALSHNNLNASAISTGSNGSSASADTSTPTSSPPRNQPVVMPISARVCDRCYFSAPSGSAGGGAPLLLPPNHAGVSPPTYADGASFASAASAFALSARPLTTFNLRHPPSRGSSASASRASSPNSSPPGGSSGHLSRQASHSRSRQRRQGSAVSASASASSSSHSTSFPSDSTNATPSTPSTSVEGAADNHTAASSCGSTASSTNGTSPEMLQMASHHARGGAPPSAGGLASAAAAASSTNRRGSSLGRNGGSKRTLCSGTVATPKIVHEGEVLSSYETETDERNNKSAAAAGGEVGGGGGVGAKLAAAQRRRPQSQPARVSAAAAVNDGTIWVPTTRYRSASNDPEGNSSSSVSSSSSTDGDHRPALGGSRRPQRQSQQPKAKQADASRYYVESDSSSVSEDSDDDDDDDENDERHERVVRERRLYQQEYGSVQGGPWQSWATF